MPVGNYAQYRALARVNPLVAGDLLIKKVFPETRNHLVEWGITTGQKLFQGDQTVKVGGLFRSEKFQVAYRGSHTSEHAAVAIAADELAEAVGEGVITASVRGRREERYIVYRCRNATLRDAAIVIAKGLSNAYRNVVTGGGPTRSTTGGKYSLGGAFTSSLRGATFQPGTDGFLTQVVDYVYGVSNNRPNMFCSQFAMTCYEAASVAAFGKTAMGTNPRAMSPMEMENVINGRQDLFTLVGRYDSEGDVLFSAVVKGLRTYDGRWHWGRQSEASAGAVKALHALLEIGDDDYLLAAVAALLNAEPTGRAALRCQLPQGAQLAPTSQLYRDLVAALTPTHLLKL